MQGFETLWLPGMDHAGIATQTLVERHLAEDEGLSRHDLSREEFVERVWAWKAEYGGSILGQMRRFGCGVDWSRERFTMDEGLSRSVQTIFKRLFDDELIYRAERIINWCPRCMTALSDIEVDHQDDDGELVSIRYGDGESSIVVATTRAETMLGDTAVAVHPDDPRYSHLVGTEVELPLTSRRIPWSPTSTSTPSSAPARSRSRLPTTRTTSRSAGATTCRSLVVMDERGVVTAKGPFEGLDRFEARPAVVAALRERAGSSPRSARTSTRSGTAAGAAPSSSRRHRCSGSCRSPPLATRGRRRGPRRPRRRFVPEMAPRYFDWVDDMHDWCISRQLWWGHRIPRLVWPDGEVRCVGPGAGARGRRLDAGPGRARHVVLLGAVAVLDARLARRPRPDLRAFYPTNVLVTGYDIIFFWVARMMMFGLYAMASRRRARRRRRRAVPRPSRCTASCATSSQEDEQVEGTRSTRSTGWTPTARTRWRSPSPAARTRVRTSRSARSGCRAPATSATSCGTPTRFALLNGPSQLPALPAWDDLSTADRWILARLDATVATVNAHYDAYEFANVVDALYHFTWDEFCNWSSSWPDAARARRRRGRHDPGRARRVLDVVLRLLHPLSPRHRGAVDGAHRAASPWSSRRSRRSRPVPAAATTQRSRRSSACRRS